MRKLLILLLLVVLLVPTLATAQDDGECDVSAITTEFSERIANAETIEEVSVLNKELSLMLSPCEYPVFSGDAIIFEGNTLEDGFVGPIEIETGWYLIEIIPTRKNKCVYNCLKKQWDANSK